MPEQQAPTSLPDQRERIEQMLAQLADIAQLQAPITDENALEFFTSNWENCLNGLLQRTDRIRVTPEAVSTPVSFSFEIDTPYKRKIGDGPVELMPGPVLGRILYRRDMFEEPEGRTVAVMIDPKLGYFHPNYSRTSAFLCIGDESNFEDGPLPLDRLLEAHIFPVVSYQNRRPTHPMDLEAARYFALDPSAMDGLESVQPLY